MLRRLRRPGYWIVLFALLSVYFYHLYQKKEEERHRQALLNLYRTYGEEVLGEMHEGNLSGVQRYFASGEEGRISLEDIALFVSTLHLDQNHKIRWSDVQEGEGNITMQGSLILEGNMSYPMDMMVVRQGDRILLRRLHVGSRTLELHPEGFPFRSVSERNVSLPNPSASTSSSH